MELLINGKIVKISNGEHGYQPEIIVQGEDYNYYIITATPERKFITSLLENFNEEK